MNSTGVGKTQCCSQDYHVRDRVETETGSGSRLGPLAPESITRPRPGNCGLGLRFEDHISWSWFCHGLWSMWTQSWLRLEWAGLVPRASCASVEEYLTIWCFKLAYVISELETVQNLNYFIFILHNNDSYFSGFNYILNNRCLYICPLCCCFEKQPLWQASVSTMLYHQGQRSQKLLS